MKWLKKENRSINLDQHEDIQMKHLSEATSISKLRMQKYYIAPLLLNCEGLAERAHRKPLTSFFFPQKVWPCVLVTFFNKICMKI